MWPDPPAPVGGRFIAISFHSLLSFGRYSRRCRDIVATAILFNHPIHGALKNYISILAVFGQTMSCRCTEPSCRRHFAKEKLVQQCSGPPVTLCKCAAVQLLLLGPLLSFWCKTQLCCNFQWVLISVSFLM